MARAADDRAVLRRCRALVRRFERTVAVPSPFDLTVFLQRWTAHRTGRPVELLPMDVGDMPADACGLWLAFADRDVIAFPADAPANHRDHIVLHEVGHILAGHGGPAAAPVASGLLALLPDLEPGMVRAVLGRTCGSGVQEREAELIASLLLQHRPVTARSGPQHPVAARIERAFGRRPGSGSAGEPADDR